MAAANLASTMSISGVPTVKLRHDLKTEEKSEREEEPVPANFDWAENENCRIYVPNQMAHLRSYGIIFRRVFEFRLL